jgi:hypothetical protein
VIGTEATDGVVWVPEDQARVLAKEAKVRLLDFLADAQRCGRYAGSERVRIDGRWSSVYGLRQAI